MSEVQHPRELTKTEDRYEIVHRLLKSRPDELLSRQDNFISGELLLDHEDGTTHLVGAVVTRDGVFFWWRLGSLAEELLRKRERKAEEKERREAAAAKKSSKKLSKKERAKLEEEEARKKKKKKKEQKKAKEKAKAKGKKSKLPKHVDGFIVLYEVKVEAVGRAQNRFQVVTRQNQDRKDVFEASGYTECAKWREAIFHCSAVAKREMQEEAEAFWTDECGAELKLEAFGAALDKFLADRGREAATEAQRDVLFRLVASVPKTEADTHHATVTKLQLLSFCTSFGRITDSYQHLEGIVDWYVGTLHANDLDDPFPHPVHAHSYFIYLQPLSQDSSFLKVFYTDGGLHSHEDGIILEPRGKTVHLEHCGGHCFDSIYEMVHESRILIYPVAKHVLAKRTKRTE